MHVENKKNSTFAHQNIYLVKKCYFPVDFFLETLKTAAFLVNNRSVVNNLLPTLIKTHIF